MIRPVLIYDGDCAFCRRSVAWFKAHDLAGRLEYLPRQAPERAQRYPQLNDAKYQGALQLVMPTGEIRSGEIASATALTFLTDRKWQWLGALIMLPGIRQCAHIGYKIIAKNRHRIKCDGGSCKI